MPTKFRPTEKSYDRRTGKTAVVRHYMKAIPKKELIDYLNKDSSPNKKKHKVLKELKRRGINLVWKTKEENA